jgi:hypothetical protein
VNRFETQPQTRKACQAILRFVRQRRLGVGDRLPAQDELCRELGVCFNTLIAAMGALVAAGFVARKTRTGTVIRSLCPETSDLRIWRVGIALLHEEEGTFVLMLQHHLRRQLAAAGCLDQTYFIAENVVPAAVADRRLADFPGLEEDVETGMLDAVITPTRLWSDRIPVCSVPGHDRARRGVTFDQKRWVEDAFAEFLRRGVRRIALVHRSPPPTDFAAPWLAYTDCAIRNGVPPDYVTNIRGFDGGIQACEGLIARPAEARPDALIITNDHVAQGFACRLRLGAGEYQPLVAAQTNRQAPLNFPSPVIRYELDIEVLARRAVAYLLDWLLEPGLERAMEQLTLETRT